MGLLRCGWRSQWHDALARCIRAKTYPVEYIIDLCDPLGTIQVPVSEEILTQFLTDWSLDADAFSDFYVHTRGLSCQIPPPKPMLAFFHYPHHRDC